MGMCACRGVNSWILMFGLHFNWYYWLGSTSHTFGQWYQFDPLVNVNTFLFDCIPLKFKSNWARLELMMWSCRCLQVIFLCDHFVWLHLVCVRLQTPAHPFRFYRIKSRIHISVLIYDLRFNISTFLLFSHRFFYWRHVWFKMAFHNARV